MEISGKILLLEGEIVEYESEELKDAYQKALKKNSKFKNFNPVPLQIKHDFKPTQITISNKQDERKWGGMTSATLTIEETE